MAARKLPITIADGDQGTLGAKGDPAASSDTGTESLIALFKRLLSKVTAGLPIHANNFTYTKITTGTALTASWALVTTTTTATKSLRMSAACDASAYDIEYTVVAEGASAPTDTRGQALLAGEDFAAGIPVGDIYARSATLQRLIIWSA